MCRYPAESLDLKEMASPSGRGKGHVASLGHSEGVSVALGKERREEGAETPSPVLSPASQLRIQLFDNIMLAQANVRAKV